MFLEVPVGVHCLQRRVELADVTRSTLTMAWKLTLVVLLLITGQVCVTQLVHVDVHAWMMDCLHN